MYHWLWGHILLTPAAAETHRYPITFARRPGLMSRVMTTSPTDARVRELEQYRGELHAHCYRMLGSVHDAEDALQEAMIRAWKALPRFDGRSSLRTWLYKIATNTCLDSIAKRPKRVLPVDYGPASDPHTPPAE